MEKRRFLSVAFDVGSRREVLDRLAFLLESPPGRPATVIAHGNIHALFMRSLDPDPAGFYPGANSVVLFEGIGLKLGRLITSGQWWPDHNGTDLAPALLEARGKIRTRVALVGGEAGVAATAARRIEADFANARVVLACDGYESLRDESDLIERLRAARPDILFLGLGTPLQEACARRWAQQMEIPLVWAVGGLFDFWSGRVRRAPRALRTMRLEWLWRFCREPCRLWPRVSVEALWLVRALLREAVHRRSLSEPAVGEEAVFVVSRDRGL